MSALTRLLSVVLLCGSLLAACAAPDDDSQPADSHDASGGDVLELPAGAGEAADAIDEETVRKVISNLADDRMEGRGPGTDGDRMAQKYIADFLASHDIEPGAADGSYLQSFDIVGINSKMPETWKFAAGDETLSFGVLEDFVAASGTQTNVAEVKDAELVFVGYGIRAPEYEWDDYKDADLAGKVLVMLNNDPDWDPNLFAGTTRLYYGRWTYKYEVAGEVGAAGAIIIHTTPSAGYPWQVVQTSWTGEQFELPAGDEPRTSVEAWLTNDAATELIAAAGFDLDELRQAARLPGFEPVELGITTSLRLTNRLSQTQTANVIGVIPGRDAALADEAVIFTAHHDHLGIGIPDDEGDAIYNGAMDNASGVAMVLAAAKSIATMEKKPRRSIVFALVGAEEQGLLGSQFYASHPTFPPGKIAANVNLDGGNPWGLTSDITYVGYGKSSLDAVVEAVAASQGRNVVADQFPDRGYFYRSDQFNFAKIGVPAIYLDNGTHFVGRPENWGREQVDRWTEEHYHQVSDEYDPSWDVSGMLEDARLAMLCALAVAEQKKLPAWNEGDEFEAARLEAIDAAAH